MPLVLLVTEFGHTLGDSPDGTHGVALQCQETVRHVVLPPVMLRDLGRLCKRISLHPESLLRVYKEKADLCDEMLGYATGSHFEMQCSHLSFDVVMKCGKVQCVTHCRHVITPLRAYQCKVQSLPIGRRQEHDRFPNQLIVLLDLVEDADVA